ncbi:hypothetical protein FQN60_012849 [Etheostoma spectabile]|uniref:Protein SREK1IP1 n=1 Tax=Etheostoma spectabile TaxID=54343 RepID=A0A5J5D7X3_9PERO|nr:hypothetical protein FQN60_012849 [Etheostoma spectabile]
MDCQILERIKTEKALLSNLLTLDLLHIKEPSLQELSNMHRKIRGVRERETERERGRNRVGRAEGLLFSLLGGRQREFLFPTWPPRRDACACGRNIVSGGEVGSLRDWRLRPLSKNILRSILSVRQTLTVAKMEDKECRGPNKDNIRAGCKKCGYPGHLTFECRNFVRVDPQKDIVLDVSSTSSEESEDDEPAPQRNEKLGRSRGSHGDDNNGRKERHKRKKSSDRKSRKRSKLSSDENTKKKKKRRTSDSSSDEEERRRKKKKIKSQKKKSKKNKREHGKHPKRQKKSKQESSSPSSSSSSESSDLSD